MEYVQKLLWNALVAVDQMANVVFSPMLNQLVSSGGAMFGDPDETLSSVFGKNIKTGTCPVCRTICRFIGLVDNGHCEKSIEIDEGSSAPTAGGGQNE